MSELMGDRDESQSRLTSTLQHALRTASYRPLSGPTEVQTRLWYTGIGGVLSIALLVCGAALLFTDLSRAEDWRVTIGALLLFGLIGTAVAAFSCIAILFRAFMGQYADNRAVEEEASLFAYAVVSLAEDGYFVNEIAVAVRQVAPSLALVLDSPQKKHELAARVVKIVEERVQDRAASAH